MDHLVLVDSVRAVPDDGCRKLVMCGMVLLEEETAHSFIEMQQAAAGDGIGIRAFSGYRSAAYQKELFIRSVCGYMSDGLSRSDAEALTARYLARPGHSEHQTGLACDICRSDCDDADESFSLTKESLWLNDNCFRFGFILRYPRMKEHITGIAYEPWHYRYVGAAHAADIMNNGITLEEYLYYRELAKQLLNN